LVFEKIAHFLQKNAKNRRGLAKIEETSDHNIGPSKR
jgi:hypothetical protein